MATKEEERLRILVATLETEVKTKGKKSWREVKTLETEVKIKGNNLETRSRSSKPLRQRSIPKVIP
jgi:hypothetical protein